MPIEVIEFKGDLYPKYQSEGFAARFAFPFAKEFCKGTGYDIGCNRLEWKLPDAIGIDPLLDPDHDAMNLPVGEVDYIFSSHCLEHLPRWDDALEHWVSRLKSGGVLFLYLPHYYQRYWRVGNNRKHIHNLKGDEIQDFLLGIGCINVMATGADLNHSFYVIAEKA